MKREAKGGGENCEESEAKFETVIKEKWGNEKTKEQTEYRAVLRNQLKVRKMKHHQSAWLYVFPKRAGAKQIKTWIYPGLGFWLMSTHKKIQGMEQLAELTNHGIYMNTRNSSAFL